MSELGEPAAKMRSAPVLAGAKARSDVRFPFILGQDAAGVVVQVGGEVSTFGIGTAVFGAFWMAGFDDPQRRYRVACSARNPCDERGCFRNNRMLA